MATTDATCPYEYLVGQYRKHHFAPFAQALRPSLQVEDPATWGLVLDIMDAVHFCLILVDDIADNSRQRRNQPAAHTLFGAPETANRAYLVLTRVVNRATRERSHLAAEVMKALEDILKGQDLSLVWRRDGLAAFPQEEAGRLEAYCRMARLKTGPLFVLLGRLLNDGGDGLDDTMTRFGWYAQVQNDCKNIYSAEYALNKGVVAEDLRNGELTYPIVQALILDGARGVVAKSLRSRFREDIEEALEFLETPAVKDACFKTMEEARDGVEQLEAVWGRRERMDSRPAKSQ
ncbi:prenyl transferase [Apiospora saccharicola]